MVQMGVLEIHPWGSRVDKPHRAERMIFDLDPGEDVPWPQVQEAALLMRTLLEELGHDPLKVSHEVVLACPENFANRPVAVKVDVRRQLTVLEHQIARLARIDRILDDLPAGLTFDLGATVDGVATRPRADLVAALHQVGARYTPACIAGCDLAFFCRDEAAHRTATLGPAVREELGGVETVAEALGLADGTLVPSEDQRDVAALLRTARRLYDESGGAPDFRPAA
jgi:hypothetical protein